MCRIYMVQMSVTGSFSSAFCASQFDVLEVFVLQIGLIRSIIFRWQRNRKWLLAINCTKQINVIFRMKETLSLCHVFFFFFLLFTVKDSCMLKQHFHLCRLLVVPAGEASHQAASVYWIHSFTPPSLFTSQKGGGRFV